MVSCPVSAVAATVMALVMAASVGFLEFVPGRTLLAII